VGSTISVPFGGRQIPVQVVGSVEAIPTVGEDSDGLIIDLQALNVAAIGLGWPLPKANEWWLATGSSDEARVTLESDPKLAARVQDRHHVAAAQWRDPFARGAQTALLIGFVAALLFAAIGFVVNAAITARERRAELSLLRALGTRPGTLTRAIAVEQLIVVGLGAVVGLLLGAVVAHEVLPLIIASPDGSLTPAIAVTFPWRGLSFMLAGSIAGLLAVTLAVARASTRTVSAALQNVDDSR
jgi:predicted lysophospholipase L1 biosynthesis ABC-type transport system permease subunit